VREPLAADETSFTIGCPRLRRRISSKAALRLIARSASSFQADITSSSSLHENPGRLPRMTAARRVPTCRVAAKEDLQLPGDCLAGNSRLEAGNVERRDSICGCGGVQQPELALSEVGLGIADARASSRQVALELPGAQDVRRARSRRAEMDANPGEGARPVRTASQVVLGAELERLQLGTHVVARRDHDHGQVGTMPLNLLERLHPLTPGRTAQTPRFLLYSHALGFGHRAEGRTER
jgi:hypothetical protein